MTFTHNFQYIGGIELREIYSKLQIGGFFCISEKEEILFQLFTCNIYITGAFTLYGISDTYFLRNSVPPDSQLIPVYIKCFFNLVRVAPDCNRSYCEDSFSGYSGSV